MDLKKSPNTQEMQHSKPFKEKEKWKALPGNRYNISKGEKPPKLELVNKPLPEGLVLDWI